MTEESHGNARTEALNHIEPCEKWLCKQNNRLFKLSEQPDNWLIRFTRSDLVSRLKNYQIEFTYGLKASDHLGEHHFPAFNIMPDNSCVLTLFNPDYISQMEIPLGLAVCSFAPRLAIPNQGQKHELLTLDVTQFQTREFDDKREGLKQINFFAWQALLVAVVEEMGNELNHDNFPVKLITISDKPQGYLDINPTNHAQEAARLLNFEEDKYIISPTSAVGLLIGSTTKRFSKPINTDTSTNSED